MIVSSILIPILIISNILCYGAICSLLRAAGVGKFTSMQTFGMGINLAFNSIVTFLLIKTAAILGITGV